VRGRVTARSLDAGRILWSRPLEAPDAIGAWGANVLATSRETALVAHGDTPCYVGPCHRGVLEEFGLTGQTIRSCAIPESLQVTPYALRGGAVWGIAPIGEVGHFGRVVALGLPGADESQQGWVTPWGGGAGELRER